jgi:ankyrin repeat protein
MFADSDVAQMRKLLRHDRGLLQRAGPRALRKAAGCCGTSPSVEFLLKQGVRLTIDPRSDWNDLLNIAWAPHDLDNLRLLLEYGADATVTGNTSHWPARNISLLHLGARNGSLDLISMVLKHGGAVHLASRLDGGRGGQEGGSTPLQIAARAKDWHSSSRHHDVARMLIARGAHYDIFSACGLGDAKRLRTILRADRDAASSREQDRSTPLHWTAYSGSLACASILLKRKAAPVDAENNNRRTPLHMAAEQGHARMIEYLVTRGGAAVNSKDSKGRTPLHQAMYNGHRDAAEALLALGARTTVPNKAGKTPLEVARKACLSLRRKPRRLTSRL